MKIKYNSFRGKCFYMEWGKKIKEARKAAHLTQAELADKLGVHRSTIANYEIERRKPTFVELKQIAVILNVDVNYLVEGQEVSAEDELITRATDVFSDLNISNADKDLIFQDIMQIYMKGKKQDEAKTPRRKHTQS